MLFRSVVAKDNTVRYQGLSLQIPQDPHRFHYVKVTVRVHEYPDGPGANIPSSSAKPVEKVENDIAISNRYEANIFIFIVKNSKDHRVNFRNGLTKIISVLTG